MKKLLTFILVCLVLFCAKQGGDIAGTTSETETTTAVGKLVDRMGKGVANADVSFYDASTMTLDSVTAKQRNQNSAAPSTGKTDATGKYSVKIDTGIVYNMQAMDADSNMSMHLNIHVKALGVFDLGTDTLKPAGKISGTVVLPADSDFSGIIVYVGGTSYMSITDESGRYAITGIPEGVYNVTFKAVTGYLKTTADSIEVISGSTTDMGETTLDLDESGKPRRPQRPSADYDTATGIAMLHWSRNLESDILGYVIQRKLWDADSNISPYSNISMVNDTLFFDKAGNGPDLGSKYSYRIISKDTQELESDASPSVVVEFATKNALDTTGPTIIVASPSNNDVVNVSQIAIYASVSDPSGVKSVTIDDSAATKEGAYWKATVKLEADTNLIEIVALDNSGKTNRSTASIRLIYDTGATDNTSPVIVFVWPVSGETLSAPTITVLANIFDPSGVAWAKLRGTSMPIANGKYSASASLVQGENRIDVQAADMNGNIAADTLTIYYDSLASDTVQPSLTIDSPQDYVHINDTTVLVSGTATDNSGISQITVNGHLAAFSAPNWSYSLSLKHGYDTIHVIAKDAALHANSTADTLIIISNHAPVFSSKSDTSITKGQVYSTVVHAAETDGDLFSFRLLTPTTGLPIMVSGQTSATISYTPAAVGIDTFRIEAKDAWNDADTLTWKVNVTEPGQTNRAPFFVDTSTISRAVVAGQAYSADLNAIDPDNNVLKFHLDQAPNGATIDSLSGVIHWSPTIQDTGTKAFAVSVSDAQFTATFSWNVVVAMYNRKPLLTNPGNKTAGEGQALNFTLTAVDSDGNSLTYSMVQFSQGATLTNNQFSWTPNYSQSGTHTFAFTVKDDGNPSLSDTESIEISVSNTNRAPTFLDSSSRAGSEGQQLTFNLTAADPDSDSLTYSMITPPTGATLVEKAFSWTPSFQQAGSYSVTFIVSDGKNPVLSDTESVTITVSNNPALDLGGIFTKDANTVALWRFDTLGTTRTDTIFDVSGNGNHAKLYGPAWVTGKSGAALSFDGVNDYAATGDCSSPVQAISGTQPYTIEMWYKSNVKPSASDHDQILLSFSETGQGFSGAANFDKNLMIEPNGNVRFRQWSGGDLTADGYSNAVDNAWHYMAGVFDGTQMKVYVDGRIQFTASATGSQSFTSPQIVFSYIYYADPKHEYTNGTIDEVRMSNIARTQQEIENVWTSTGGLLSLPTAGLLGYYPFNGNANDESGNANNGTISGSPSLIADRKNASNRAYNFNGSDAFVDLGSSMRLGDPNTSFTIAAWFRTTTSTYGAIVGDYDGTPTAGDDIFSANMSLCDNSQSSKIATGTRNLSLTGYANDANSSRSNLNDGQWHLLVYQGDAASSKLRLYIDNVLDHETNYNPTYNYYSVPHWRVGATRFASTSPNQFFPGAIDDVRIYSRALTASEISALFNE